MWRWHNGGSRAFAGICSVLMLLSAGAAEVAAPKDNARELRHADDIKTANHAEFLDILRRVEQQSAQLDPTQRSWLEYLRAWDLLYVGDYEAGGPALKSVIGAAQDATVRFRARISLINLLALAARYNEAYAQLSDLLEEQPQIQDQQARSLAFAVAALLYNQAGQYDLGLNYAERWLRDDFDGTGACKAMYLKLDALFRSGKLQPAESEVASGIDACTRIGEPIYSNLIRTFVANAMLSAGDVAGATELLEEHDAEVQQTHYARLTSEFHSILARAYLLRGEVAKARQYALSAIDKSIKKEYSKPLVDAYEVLYLAAKHDGNLGDALAYHEKFASADKGYLTDTTARTLAYQMVNQQVLDKKRQIDVLNERNQVLQLQEEVASKAAETERLYVTLLICGLAFIALWAYRTKRSQVRFQKLSRRDGLTGVINRQHFMEEAKYRLQYCAKSSRPASLILIDLDYFKLINDTHGHAAGDAVLKQTVDACQVLMRSVDLFGRLGGEEFGVLLPDCDLAVAQARAEELRAAVATIVSPGSDSIVSASFGVTSTVESSYDLRQMLIHADSALYRAKRGGRNRVERYLPGQEPALANA